MQYLLDGNNVLFAARHVLPSPAMGRHQLCRVVGAWAGTADCDVTIVFDGPPPRPALVEQMHQAGVTVVFAGARSADDVIQDLIDGARSPANLCIVSTDGAIESAARHRACPHQKSQDFLGQIAVGARATSDTAPPLEKPEETSPPNTEEWLRHFGLAEGGHKAADGAD